MLAWGGRNWILGTLLVTSTCLLIYILISVPIFLILTLILLILEMFLLNFFRDPPRIIGKGIVSPADGKIISIERNYYKSKSKKYIHLAIFMSVFNVHVNRAPIQGRIMSMTHKMGGYIPAYKPESEQNERIITKIASPIGEITITQIAGILAKRIIPYIKPGQTLKKGQRIGIIQFGSRVDLILPQNMVQLTVQVGQQVRAGRSTIAHYKYK